MSDCVLHRRQCGITPEREPDSLGSHIEVEVRGLAEHLLTRLVGRIQRNAMDRVGVDGIGRQFEFGNLFVAVRVVLHELEQLGNLSRQVAAGNQFGAADQRELARFVTGELHETVDVTGLGRREQSLEDRVDDGSHARDAILVGTLRNLLLRDLEELREEALLLGIEQPRDRHRERGRVLKQVAEIGSLPRHVLEEFGELAVRGAGDFKVDVRPTLFGIHATANGQFFTLIDDLIEQFQPAFAIGATQAIRRFGFAVLLLQLGLSLIFEELHEQQLHSRRDAFDEQRDRDVVLTRQSRTEFDRVGKVPVESVFGTVGSNQKQVVAAMPRPDFESLAVTDLVAS